MKYLKHKIKEIPYIGHFFISVYKYLAPDLQSLIVKYISNHQVIILQIGSNDGKTGDPLFSMICDNKNWNAIFVEPVPYLFKRLKENYGGDPRFNFENIAINEGKEQIFYSVNYNANELLSDLPFWYDQLGSFNRDNIMNHLDGILEPFIEETKLEGVTLMGLLDKYSIKKLDILHIDTEGYDWEILKQLPLNKFLPKMILYEHKHLRSDDKKASITFLKNDYHIFDFGNDFFSIKKGVINSFDIFKLRTKLIH